MATLEIAFLNSQLQERKRRLEEAIALVPQRAGLASLLREVDSALERMDKGRYGLCHTYHDPVEEDRLLADPLVRYCLDYLTPPQRDAQQPYLDNLSTVPDLGTNCPEGQSGPTLLWACKSMICGEAVWNHTCCCKAVGMCLICETSQIEIALRIRRRNDEKRTMP